MIAVIDSGVANLASVLAALSRLGRRGEVTTDAKLIGKADYIILPGVGAAAAAMEQLRRHDLVDALRAARQPLLGICLGMQLLFARSQESGGVDCLRIIPGTIKALSAAPSLPVPHMGWNRIHHRESGQPLLHGIDDGSFLYFAHSFAASGADHAMAFTEYGERFAAIVSYENFFGCQFHPERSGTPGLRLIENFLRI
ncbi:MAG TPA: imidazole glycerol phosphate synthase subunit HisH [Rhizomicrobium sp.]|nr:imidazole glycerol phosphate synthase subunit HisH [Rhizomicrobium sp.]